jgi:membrane dipeptidase
MLAHFRHWLGTRGDCYRVVKTPADILAAKENGQLGICFDIEGMNALDDQLSLIQLYYDLGVRWMLIAYNKNNRAGGGCHDEDAGLTAFGRQAIEEMARVGMVLCCSHAGYRTAREAIEFSPGPVIFSHSNPRALWNHPRNISDELIRACAARGGVIGISGIGIFLGSNDNATDTLVRHIDHVVQSVGDDHVALGLDYVFDLKELDEYLETMKATFPSTTYQPAMGMKMVEPERLPRLVEAMMTRGYSTVSLGKILGGNWLRIAQTVWKC